MKNVFLRYPTKPMDVSRKSISQLTNEMILTGFQGRKLGEAIETWAEMLERDDIVIFFGLAGAMVPAGMRKIIAYLIEKRMIDVLVSTGANLFHDLCESLGVKHFIGTDVVDDVKLRTLRVDRIYDVFADEKKYCIADKFIAREFCIDALKDDYPYSSREILYLLGKYLDNHELTKDKNSILISAFKNNLPIFSPALNDSMIGADIMAANRPWKDKSKSKIKRIRGKTKHIKVRKIVLNALKDVDEITRITEKASETGVIYIGGGTPKNFTNQSAIMANFLTHKNKSHSFAIQITTDIPEWGGLSGCTFKEAQSWGKFKPSAKMVMCHCDATIALPIMVHALMEKCNDVAEKRKKPIFNWSGNDLKLRYA